jgi:phosphoribosylformylglycinamidine cyclo-ligase
VGLASSGQTTYEDAYNGGMGSNGLTSARHDVFKATYAARYPESYDQSISKELVYSGQMDLLQAVEGVPVNAGKLVLSPTRTYAPVISKIVQTMRHHIHGMVHCSGGGQTKIMNFVDDMHVIKDQLFPVPPLFEIIKTQSGSSEKEMYQVFNMGHRMEIITSMETAAEIIDICKDFRLEARVIGRCEKHQGKKLTLKTQSATITYQ